ncbi:uncharacterized protein Tco025E_00130 [Trypanosoma conorhini]|uniref:Uncharacterized protein n=1 Tax=Trypanosoma conorhini TaxID=83891 RepID=A0A422QD11_9TRYP|nr:uncharacterized protein Tco025E_00130 [Trypanosoma conorhini]RNF27746.1 hypothetical protein Tco025E_00130 [Trypanosoma conorhini]
MRLGELVDADRVAVGELKEVNEGRHAPLREGVYAEVKPHRLLLALAEDNALHLPLHRGGRSSLHRAGAPVRTAVARCAEAEGRDRQRLALLPRDEGAPAAGEAGGGGGGGGGGAWRLGRLHRREDELPLRLRPCLGLWGADCQRHLLPLRQRLGLHGVRNELHPTFPHDYKPKRSAKKNKVYIYIYV